MSEKPTQINLKTLWAKALTDIQHQMTRATFDTWLKETELIADEDGTFVISTPNPYAVEWLANRLNRIIKQNLERHVGRSITLRFVVAAELTTDPAEPASAEPAAENAENGAKTHRAPRRKSAIELATKLVDFDPAKKSWTQTPAYAVQFWQPYLGIGPFALWLTLRSFAQATIGAWPSLQTLADITAGGDKQILTGRDHKGKHREGWLEVLEREGLVKYDLKGHTYEFLILDSLPLLTPAQVAQLPEQRRKAHERWLHQCQIEEKDWQRITTTSLVET
jgi:hypothetical protein